LYPADSPLNPRLRTDHFPRGRLTRVHGRRAPCVVRLSAVVQLRFEVRRRALIEQAADTSGVDRDHAAAKRHRRIRAGLKSRPRNSRARRGVAGALRSAVSSPRAAHRARCTCRGTDRLRLPMAWMFDESAPIASSNAARALRTPIGVGPSSIYAARWALAKSSEVQPFRITLDAAARVSARFERAARSRRRDGQFGETDGSPPGGSRPPAAVPVRVTQSPRLPVVPRNNTSKSQSGSSYSARENQTPCHPPRSII